MRKQKTNGKLEIKYVKISDLKVAEYNPRKMPEEEMQKLKNSILEFGFIDPVIANKNGTIVGGHQRVKAAIELEIKEVPVVFVDITDNAREKVLNIALNKISGEFDMEKLGPLLREIESKSQEQIELLLLTGFNTTEIDDILNAEKQEDEKGNDMPDMSKVPPKTKQGDLWKLGEHFLLCGDSTKEENVDKVLNGDKTVSMIFTDPPYNVDYEGGAPSKNKREKIANDKMSKKDFGEFLRKICRNANERSDGGIYICMSSSEIDQLKREFEREGGYWSNFIIWVKNYFTISRGDYHHQFEPILYGWPKKIKKHYFSGRRNIPNVWEEESLDIKNNDNGTFTIRFEDQKRKRNIETTVAKLEDFKVDDKAITEIWHFDKPNISKEHPTMKPVELCSRAILNSSKIGGTVLDFFGGSGSTLIACEKHNRKARLIELSEHYCDTIIKRWEDFTGEKAVKI